MADQYQNYLATVNQAAGTSSLNYYNAGLAAAQAAYNQSVTDDAEYYNSDDEGEHLCTAAPPPYPQSYINQPGAITYDSIAKNNQYLSQKTPYQPAPCNPTSTTAYNDGCSKYGVDAHTASYTPTYNYSKNICNLKYTAPKSKTTFSLAYKKPIARVYVYNNYIQKQDNYKTEPYCEKKNYDMPSTTYGTYTTT
jgi:hypothetical protein